MAEALDLLPANATDLERALSLTAARAADVPTPQRDLWNPDTCPAALLPLLAWALSVDLWDDAWPEARKRAVIKAAVMVHRHKGTPAAVETFLAALGYEAQVQEWAEYGGDPYKFRVAISTLMASEGDYRVVAEGVETAKNARSWLDAITVPMAAAGSLEPAGLARVGVGISATLWCSPEVDPVNVQALGLARVGLSITATLPQPSVEAEPAEIFVAGLVRWGWPITATLKERT